MHFYSRHFDRTYFTQKTIIFSPLGYKALNSFFEGRRKQLWLKHTFCICHFFFIFSFCACSTLRVKALVALPILEVKECKLEQFWSRFERRFFFFFFPLPMFSGCAGGRGCLFKVMVKRQVLRCAGHCQTQPSLGPDFSPSPKLSYEQRPQLLSFNQSSYLGKQADDLSLVENISKNHPCLLKCEFSLIVLIKT